MTRQTWRRSAVAALLLILPIAGGPPRSARAQATAAQITPIEEILPLDDVESMQKARETARELAGGARLRLAVSKEREASARAYLEAKKAEIEGLKKRIEAADKAKDEARKKSLEGDRRIEEQRQRLLERVLDLRRAESEYNDATAEAASLEASYQELALDLADRRKKAADIASAVSESDRLGRARELRDREKGFVEAFRRWAEAARSAAEKRKTMADRRADAWDAWKIVTGLSQ